MIQLFHVLKEYDKGVPILNDVNLTIEKGEFVFLTGPSGAGKTTILRLLTCELAPTSGQILVMDRHITQLKPRQIPLLRRKIGVVFQDFRLLPRRTVAENVALPLEVQNLTGKEVNRRVYLMLKRVGLAHRARATPNQISGGEQQRVALARALITEPAILLADEPTGNLDEDTTRVVIKLIDDAHALGTTVVFATHARHLYENSGRRVVRLENGRAVFDSEIRLDHHEAQSQMAVSAGGRRRLEEST